MRHRFVPFVGRVVRDPRPDAELLARWRSDQAAFASLVSRHGPMVWGVCRQLLGDAEAEDAFHATFVALLRSTLRAEASLGAWLHGTAVRVSIAARRAAGRRRVREGAAAAPESVPPDGVDDWADTMAVVHREVARLPAADRPAFVLCVLEGLTQAEAAARLDRTPGAVAGQVARAKKRLVDRLTRRGIVPGLAALGSVPAAGAVPPALAKKVSGLPGLASPVVLRLAKGASAMSLPKLIAGGAALCVTLAAGILVATGGPQVPHAVEPPARVRVAVAHPPTVNPDGVRDPGPAKHPEPPVEVKPTGTLGPTPANHPPRPGEAKPDARTQANLSFWVPEEELRVWDPVNPNVNPVPWRVFGARGKDGQRSAEFRHLAVGKAVRVEGIGWGYDVKTDLPKSRVVFEGGTVLVKGIDLNTPDFRGRCVRVAGVLRRGTMTHPGFGRQLPSYYYIEAASVVVIDRVTEPNVLLD